MGLLDPWVEVAPIVGFDFYHYKNNFWLHAYGNLILPTTNILKEMKISVILHRNGWGQGGHHEGQDNNGRTMDRLFSRY
jgi:hypothetical protein